MDHRPGHLLGRRAQHGAGEGVVEFGKVEQRNRGATSELPLTGVLHYSQPFVIEERASLDTEETPLGKRISNTGYRWGPLGAGLVNEAEIVGVMKDIRHSGVRDEPHPSLYFNHQQAPIRRMAFTVRTVGDPTMLVSAVQSAVASVNPSLPIANLRTMQDVVDQALARDRFSTMLLSVFGLVALLLAAVGVYGVLASGIPAHRATRIDPMEAMRGE